MFGWASWAGYLYEVVPYQREVMDTLAGGFRYMMPSVFGALQVFDVGPTVALAVHSAIALCATLAAAIAFRRCNDANLRAIICIVATFVVTPYALAYDLGVFAAALILAGSYVSGAIGKVLLFVLSIWPIGMVASAAAGLPVAPVLCIALLFILLRAAFKSPETVRANVFASPPPIPPATAG